MRRLPVKCIIFLMIASSISGFSQNNVRNGKSELLSINHLYQIKDTLSSDLTSATYSVIWMDSIIQIRKTTNLVYDLASIRKFRKDSSYYPTREDSLRYMKMGTSFSQNCHSYALEQYLRYYHIEDGILFTNRTAVTENFYLDKILKTCFARQRSIKTRPRKNLKSEFRKGALLVFRNRYNTPIHSVFFDGQFHTKNGGREVQTFDELRPIFKIYWDTVWIEEYYLDASKISQYLSAKATL